MKNASTNATATVFPILFAISFSHMLNDMIQSVIPSIYPMLKENYALTFGQIGLITLAFQLTASIFQPFVGMYTDKRPNPKSLALGMFFSLMGLISIAFFSSDFYSILISVSLIGLGSSIFHPESSRVAQLASGGKKGLAQSIFQVGGNTGTAVGPLLASIIIIPFGQKYIGWFGVIALMGIVILTYVGRWYGANIVAKSSKNSVVIQNPLPRKKVVFSVSILMILLFSKYFYSASISNYYTFYMIEKFGVSVENSQIYLFIYFASVAFGTIIGGALGDKYGRKLVIWISILGVAPFTLLLPHMEIVGTVILSVIIGIIISSAFSAILVYATELIPGKVGMVAGLFFGLAFGLGGIGSAVLGQLADKTSVEYVFSICAYLPLLGIVTWFLPNIEKRR